MSVFSTSIIVLKWLLSTHKPFKVSNGVKHVYYRLYKRIRAWLVYEFAKQ